MAKTKNRTAGINEDAFDVAKSAKEVIGISMRHFISDAVWEKVGKLPKEQNEKVMSHYKKNRHSN